jgi:hypothetical protein
MPVRIEAIGHEALCGSEANHRTRIATAVMGVAAAWMFVLG